MSQTRAIVARHGWDYIRSTNRRNVELSFRKLATEYLTNKKNTSCIICLIILVGFQKIFNLMGCGCKNIFLLGGG